MFNCHIKLMYNLSKLDRKSIETVIGILVDAIEYNTDKDTSYPTEREYTKSLKQLHEILDELRIIKED